MPKFNQVKAVIFDIDGTLADTEHRVHHLRPEGGGKKNWDGFFGAMPQDPLRHDVAEVLHMYAAREDTRIIILTAREEKHKEVTEAWLIKHALYYDMLIMRNNGDRTDDHYLKLDHIKKLNDVFHIVGFFEDRKRICDAAREYGVTVFQMAAGEF